MSDDLVIIHQENKLLNLFFMAIGVIEIDSSMWFVWVTLVGYVVFFFCKFLFNIDKKKHSFFLLYTFLIAAYGLICYYVLKTPAHYYRNLWALVGGTFLATYEKELMEDKAKQGLTIITVVGYLWIQVILMNYHTYFIHGIIGLSLIFAVCLYAQYCKETNTNVYVILSSMSYYVYLFHEKIFAFMNYTIGKTNILLPLVIILLFSYLYTLLSGKIKFIK